MIFNKNYSLHRPPHIFWGNYFFITGRCVNRYPYFTTNDQKMIFRKVLSLSAKKFTVCFYAWVLLVNHYHLLLKIKDSQKLLKFITNLHTNSSRLLNDFDGLISRKIWHQYWDHCIRDKKDFWQHFNYIHHNPVKHGIVSQQKSVADYQFCSYGDWVKKQSEQWLISCFAQYPIVDFTGRE